MLCKNLNCKTQIIVEVGINSLEAIEMAVRALAIVQMLGAIGGGCHFELLHVMAVNCISSVRR